MDRFDWREPDYVSVFQSRIDKLVKIRSDPTILPKLKAYYRTDPIAFINDWGCTFDPRNLERNLPAVIPFIMFPRQVEWCEWVLDAWRTQDKRLSDKSRDMGLSWLSIGLGASLALFNENFVAGYGSRKEEYVDSTKSPKALFYKGRMFLSLVPPEFRGGWHPKKNAHMSIAIPETGAVLNGEAGDNIGRGDRASIYFVDESAFLEHPEMIDASLSQTTNCRIDLSSVNGMDNPFATKRHSWEPRRIFTFHWRDDPRKDETWYEKQKVDIDNPVIVAQEIDLDYHASKLGQLIPAAWVQASIGAAAKLGIKLTGDKLAALDVADEGKDLCAWAMRQGVSLRYLQSWSGVGDDIFSSVQTAFDLSDEHATGGFTYDADGLGAGVRGDARVINERRGESGRLILTVKPFWGSGEVIEPELQVFKADGKSNGRTNEDYFKNRKAQGWWNLRTRFQRTFRWVTLGVPCDPDEIIDIDPECPELNKLMMELSQPTYKTDGAGKILVDKTPEGMRSPNLADSVMYCFAPAKTSMSWFDQD